MTVTMRDDDLIRTHDEAEQLLRYAIPGAHVSIEPIAGEHAGTPNAMSATRRYVIQVPRIGRVALAPVALYSLPCLGAPLARHARELADAALAAP